MFGWSKDDDPDLQQCVADPDPAHAHILRVLVGAIRGDSQDSLFFALDHPGPTIPAQEP